MRSQVLFENKTRLGPEYASYVAGLVLTGEQVKTIRSTKPNLSVCQVRIINNELFVLGLTQATVKALLTKAQASALIDGATRLNAKLTVKNVLILKRALIKATIVLHKLTKRRTEFKARSKQLALARQQINSLINVNIG
ncbi:MAG: hypothetical protein AAJB65_00820 [Candidatus Hodgkinia cicadicola]